MLATDDAEASSRSPSKLASGIVQWHVLHCHTRRLDARNHLAHIDVPTHASFKEGRRRRPASYARVAAENAYSNRAAGDRVLTPYAGGQPKRQDSLNNYFYKSSSSKCSLVEQVFSVILGRFGMRCSPRRCALVKAAGLTWYATSSTILSSWSESAARPPTSTLL
jgi:hypothetical protein